MTERNKTLLVWLSWLLLGILGGVYGWQAGAESNRIQRVYETMESR